MLRSLFLSLVLADAFAVLVARADFDVPSSSSNSPALSTIKSNASANRKLGRHQVSLVTPLDCSSPSPSPTSEATHSVEGWYMSKEASSSSQPSSSAAQDFHPMKHRSSSISKSVMGGGVILGAFTATFLVAVFRYIRATGRHETENSA